MIIEINSILDTEKYIDGMDAVVFDLDDTLYSEKQYVLSGFNQVAKKFPNIPDAANRLLSFWKPGHKPFDELLKEEGLFSEENLKMAVEAYRSQSPRIYPYEGVREMMLRIKYSGKKIGIITDGEPKRQERKLVSLGLDDIPDYFIPTWQWGIEYAKPHPKSFEEMQKALNVPFEKMCYIGDNITKDFVSPEELGMRSIHFNNPDGLYK